MLYNSIQLGFFFKSLFKRILLSFFKYHYLKKSMLGPPDLSVNDRSTWFICQCSVPLTYLSMIGRPDLSVNAQSTWFICQWSVHLTYLSMLSPPDLSVNAQSTWLICQWSVDLIYLSLVCPPDLSVIFKSSVLRKIWIQAWVQTLVLGDGMKSRREILGNTSAHIDYWV
jgi:hypothetical protein